MDEIFVVICILMVVVFFGFCGILFRMKQHLDNEERIIGRLDLLIKVVQEKGKDKV
ncbi:hypothetical protein PAECIP111893_03889 [Paenibacillus plantiphilus]|uniref:DUF4083 domain-containing protein n=1 Tax=Paenibacillus plantiphilus TaxID=2905650 RepID=A0ABM9CKD9_9BACL|nr:hypothetical protein [Paenibacillus plantiphilus]CAH1215186.1 hypothetical protein PAECIP111893_03889 [Paenibacillus plantiphilus]